MRNVICVGFLDSPHVGRWLEQFQGDESLVFSLFCSSPARTLHPKIKQLEQNFPEKFVVHKLSLRLAVPLWILDNFFGSKLRAKALAAHISKFDQVPVLHLFEMQQAGYIFGDTNHLKLDSARIVYSNYGSDLFWFNRFPKHLRRITKVLRLVDTYTYECVRDLQIAKSFLKPDAQVIQIPNTGGLPESSYATPVVEPSRRSTIIVKGHQDKWGKAKIAIAGLVNNKENLVGYNVLLYSVPFFQRFGFSRTLKKAGIKFKIFGKGSLSHPEMIDLFSSARLYIGVSTSDGLPSSALEAMSAGCFPIQTNTSCLGEWFEDGVTGLLVELTEPSLSDAIYRALKEDNLVDKAVSHNQSKLKLDYNKEKLSVLAPTIYQ